MVAFEPLRIFSNHTPAKPVVMVVVVVVVVGRMVW